MSCPIIKDEPKYSPTQQKVWDAITDEPVSVNDIAMLTGLSGRTVQKALSVMTEDLKVIDTGKHRPRLYYKE
jgi:predicted Rossmann fold nucleotide-binding protein DprA/Smf involved in DNA uptake